MAAVTDNLDSKRKICFGLVKQGDDDWVIGFVIDGRRYRTAEEFEQTRREAFRIINRSSIVAEFETRDVSDTEPRSDRPTWEEYRAKHRL